MTIRPALTPQRKKKSHNMEAIDSPRDKAMHTPSSPRAVKSVPTSWDRIRTGDSIEITNAKTGQKLFSNKQNFGHAGSSRLQQVGGKSTDNDATFFSFTISAPELNNGEAIKNNMIV